ELAAAGALRQLLIGLEREGAVEVAEALLLDQDRDVVTARVLGERAYLALAERASGCCQQRVAAIGDRVLGIEGVEVDLELREQPDAALERLERRQRSAADVVVHAAPGEGGTIRNRENRNAAGLDQLAQRLDAVEETGRGLRRDAHGGWTHL